MAQVPLSKMLPQSNLNSVSVKTDKVLKITEVKYKYHLEVSDDTC